MFLNNKMRHGVRKGWYVFRLLMLFSLMVFLLTGAAVPSGGLSSQVSAFTRHLEFAYDTWTLNALSAKFAGWALSLPCFLSPDTQSQIVLDYLQQVERVNRLNAEIFTVYSDPSITDPDLTSQALQAELESELAGLKSQARAAEAVLQTQLSSVIDQAGLSSLGQVFPPSLYQVSDVPRSLVISPRTEIAQVLDISLLPEISLEAVEQLEERVLRELDHAALIVPIGGIGTYPTMVMQTTDIVWLTEMIAHEWIHNYLTLRPLGINYFTNAELRTINETTASLAGKELGRMILEKYYPDYLPPDLTEKEAEPNLALPQPLPDPNAFDFRAEMRVTRVEVDRLLTEGDVEAAEAYMEARRQFFGENGFPIRKLNQAYFAFHGAYNDVPGGGASGEDPVGPAVTAFRNQFSNLADFIKRIAWVTSFEQLQKLLNLSI